VKYCSLCPGGHGIDIKAYGDVEVFVDPQTTSSFVGYGLVTCAELAKSAATLEILSGNQDDLHMCDDIHAIGVRSCGCSDVLNDEL